LGLFGGIVDILGDNVLVVYTKYRDYFLWYLEVVLNNHLWYDYFVCSSSKKLWWREKGSRLEMGEEEEVDGTSVPMVPYLCIS